MPQGVRASSWGTPRDTGASPQPGRGRPSCPSSPSPAGGMSSHGCLCCVPPGHLYSRPLFKNVSALFQAGCSLCRHHPCSHGDTNCGVTAACSPASCSGRSPSRVPGEMLPGEMLRQDHTRPPAGLGPVFKPCFHPSVYFSPKQLLPQLPGQVCRRPTGNWARGGCFPQAAPEPREGWHRPLSFHPHPFHGLKMDPVSQIHPLASLLSGCARPLKPAPWGQDEGLPMGTSALLLEMLLQRLLQPCLRHFRARRADRAAPASPPVPQPARDGRYAAEKVRPASVRAQHFPSPSSDPAVPLPGWNFKVTQQVCWKERVCPASSSSG